MCGDGAPDPALARSLLPFSKSHQSINQSLVPRVSYEATIFPSSGTPPPQKKNPRLPVIVDDNPHRLRMYVCCVRLPPRRHVDPPLMTQNPVRRKECMASWLISTPCLRGSARGSTPWGPIYVYTVWVCCGVMEREEMNDLCLLGLRGVWFVGGDCGSTRRDVWLVGK